MYKSTTPTLILRVRNEDFDMTKIVTCHVTLKSEPSGYEKMFSEPDIDTDEKTISVTLTQEDTLRFDLGKVKVQVKAKLNNDTVIASKIVETTMRQILEEEPL